MLHIGQGKAGSTSIQTVLRANAARLLGHGVLVPETGQHTNHQDIFTYLTDDVKHHDPRLGGARADARKKALGKRFWQAALADIDRARPELVILSCENQFRPFAPAALERLTGLVRPHFDRVDVCAYLRDPASHFLSYAQQDLKKRPEFTIPSCRPFQDVLQPWMDHGPGPLSCVRFAREVLEGQDVVTDFCRRFASIDPAWLGAAETEANTTFSAEGMTVMQQFMRGHLAAPTRYHAQRPQRMKALVEAADRSCPGYARPRLFAPVREAIEARTRDLDWLGQSFGVVFPEIQPGSLSPQEADQKLRTRSSVSDICMVDPDRLAAVMAEITQLAAPRRGLHDRLRLRLKA